MRSAVFRPLALAAMLALGMARAAVPLPSYNIDPAQTTVSGISAGAFMASQLGYAYSATFRGVGLFAGGPYRCAGHSPYTACMRDAAIGPAQLAAMQGDIAADSGTHIDGTANVAGQRVYLFVGGADDVVGPGPTEAARAQYVANGVAAANLEVVQRPGTAHVFPTDFHAPGNGECGKSSTPFIANCGYDGAGAVLARLYGPLNARNDAPAPSNYIEFDQRPFTSNPGMAATGWLYVPAGCAAGARCRLHVALHGCQQAHAAVGDRFVRNTGYTRWADSNGIIVLFPQARADFTLHATAASGPQPNPNGCFDWVGWYGPDYARRTGTQVAAIKAMVDQLSGAASTGTPACFTDSNYGHTLAGRARAIWFFTYAKGSNQNMGWWNLFVTTTLRRIGPDHYVIGGC